MNTFQIIFKNLFFYYNLNTYNDIIYKNLLMTLTYKKNFTINKKFFILNKHIIKNRFLNSHEYNTLITVFSQSQYYYKLLNKLAFQYKYKKAKIFDNYYDLNYNNFNDLPKSILITLYNEDNRIKYIFRISDIINIINNSLCYMDNFIFYPIEIKNPYNNIVFTKANLYTIYFKINKSPFLMPKFFHLFFLSNFNQNNFYLNNETLIKKYILDNYLKNSSNEEKILFIKDMLVYFSDYIMISYENEIELLSIFTNCLNDYLYLKYINNITLKEFSKDQIIKKINNITKHIMLHNIKISFKNTPVLDNKHYLIERNIIIEPNSNLIIKLLLGLQNKYSIIIFIRLYSIFLKIFLCHKLYYYIKSQLT